MTRDSLIEFLWEDSRPANPGANLNAIVGRLRKALGDAELVHTVPNGYLLSDDGRYVVDVERFERGVLHGQELLRKGHAQEAAMVLGEALEAWDEPLPEESYSEWAVVLIRRLHGLFAEGLEAAARAASANGDYTSALRYAWEAVNRDPLRESAAVILARVQARAGDRAGAFDTLEANRRVLASELGIEPSAELAATREAILRNESGYPDAIPGSGGVIHPATPLVGRDRELRDLEELLGRARLVTITGPGGVGKTRLAVEAAARLDSATGVVMCSFDHIDDLDIVPYAVAHAADVIDAPERTTVGDIGAALRDRKTLLVLDGCEGVIGGVTNLVAALLARCPLLTVLVTSRERCGLPGEHVLRLGPLDHGEGSPAIQFFVERAVESDHSFRADQEAVSIVEEICQRLDGLPLALELAAAHLSSMSLSDLRRRLQPLLPTRSEPLLATVESSYRLLDEGDQKVLERLSVFPSDFNLDAAEKIAAASGQPGAVTRLVDKSLVNRVGTDRYRLLAITRAYAGRRLEERDERSAARAFHAGHYLELAESAANGLMTSDEAHWMQVVTGEMDNLRSVQRRAVEQSSIEEALAVATSLTHYAQWHLAREPIDWAEEAVELVGASDHLLYQAAIGAVSLGATNRGELKRAVSLARQALAQEDRPVWVRLTPMRALCLVALYKRQAEECHRLGAELEEMAEVADRPFFAVDSRLIRASVDVLTHQPEAASHVRQALIQSERLGIPSLIALGNELMGEALHDSRPEEALEAFHRATEIADYASCRLVSGLALLGAGATLVKLGRLEEGGERLRHAILHWRRAGNVTLQWTTLRHAAELLARVDEGDTARRILTASYLNDRSPEGHGAQGERLASLRERLGLAEEPPPTLEEAEEGTLNALEGISSSTGSSSR